MKNFFVIYQRYLDEIDNSVIIGGLQTYIENLVPIITKLDYHVTIIQHSNYDFCKDLMPNFQVVGVATRNKNKHTDLVKKARSLGDTENDILLFTTTTLVCKHNFKKSIAIQHGIYWDCETIHGKKVKFPFDMLLKDIQSFKEYKLVHKVDKIVCVDNNYVNWYRAGFLDRKLNYEVIPNFADIAAQGGRKHKENADGKIKIIFARRFEPIRGVELLPEIIDTLSGKYNNVYFTLAGNGSRLNFLKEKFAGYGNVEFKEYAPSEAISIHKEFDIAIVPTIASEGTSFSLLEAMAAGCAVVCSDVGGMANIILDEYNGLIVKPRAECFVDAISKLIENDGLRNSIVDKALETVRVSFCKEKWERSWIDVIKGLE